MSSLIDSGRATIIGLPIVDSSYLVTDETLRKYNLTPGTWGALSADELQRLSDDLPESHATYAAGSALNTAFVIAQLGGHPSGVGKLGKDANGLFYRAQAGLHKLDLTHSTDTALHNTGTCLALVDEHGERTLRSHVGAAGTLKPLDIRSSIFDGQAWVLLEGYITDTGDDAKEAMLRALTLAKNCGANVALTLSSAEIVGRHRDILMRLAEKSDLIIANAAEAQAFTGTISWEESFQALRILVDNCVVTGGGRGVLVSYRGQEAKVDAEKVQLIDATGAGDAFAGGFIHSILMGADAEQAARAGCLAAGTVISVQGPRIPTDQIARLREKIEASRTLEPLGIGTPTLAEPTFISLLKSPESQERVSLVKSLGVPLDRYGMVIPDHSTHCTRKIASGLTEVRTLVTGEIVAGKHVLYFPGSYDLVHAGHASYIQEGIDLYLDAHTDLKREDLFVVVLSDSDDLIRAVKPPHLTGDTNEPSRPIETRELIWQPKSNHPRLTDLASLPFVDLVGFIPAPSEFGELVKDRVFARWLKRQEDIQPNSTSSEETKNAVTRFNNLVRIIKDNNFHQVAFDFQEAKFNPNYDPKKASWDIASWQLLMHRFIGDVPQTERQGAYIRIISEHDHKYKDQVAEYMRACGIGHTMINDTHVISTTELIRAYGWRALGYSKVSGQPQYILD